MKLLSNIFVLVLIMAGCSLLGLLAGLWFGGNYTPNLQLGNLRGYEATAQIGLWFGLAIGYVAGSRWLAARRKDN